MSQPRTPAPRRTRRPVALAGAALLALTTLTACGGATSQAGEPLKLGLPPGKANPEFQKRFDPVRKLIEQATGRQVEVTVTSDYLAIVEAMRSGLIDLSVFSPFPTPIAKKVANVDPLVAGNTDIYSSVIICRVDSGIEKLADVAGARFAFVDPGSTSGNYIPKLMLTQAGVNPDDEVRGSYAGGHDVALLAVSEGSTDCAATASHLYERAVDKGVVNSDELRVVAESDPIPISVIIIARQGLDPKVKKAVTRAFLNDPGQAVLDAAKVTGFQRADPADFAMFRQAARELGVDLSEVR